MFTSAEKTSKPASTVKATADKTSFFRKAGEESFFNTKANGSFFGSSVQAKLNISQPNDPLEKEADETADKVMRMPDAAAPSVTTEKKEEELQRKEEPEQEEMIQPKMMVNASGSLLMRSEEEGEKEETVQPKLYSTGLMRKEADEEEEAVQRKEEEQEETVQRFADSSCCSSSVLQRKERGPPTAHTSSFTSQLQQSKGQGAPLNHSVLHNMQNRFGADFSSVRIHNNNTSAQLSNQINAQAFTHGNDIYFNHGKYNPYTSSGGTLLAHELTHTIQQGASTLHRKAKSPAITSLLQAKPQTQDLTAEPRPELIRAVHHAKSQIGKVNASQTTPDGLRVGADNLVDYFKTAMGNEAILEGNQPYRTGTVHIDNIRYKREAEGQDPLNPTGPPKLRDAMPSWCGIFTFWALSKGGIPMKKWKLGQAAVDLKSAYPPGYTPRSGDIAYKGPPYHHYAIVENATGGTKSATVNTVDGNTAGEDNLGAQVQQRSQSMSVWKAFFNPLYGLEEQLSQNPAAITPEEVNRIMADAGGSSAVATTVTPSAPAEVAEYIPEGTQTTAAATAVANDASVPAAQSATEEAPVEEAVVIPTSPKTPEEDAAYQQIMQQAGNVKTKQKVHDSAQSKADAAQLASKVPEQLDKDSQAQFHQVGKMEQQDKQAFNAESFKQKLSERIESALPKDDNETVDRYEHPHKGTEAMNEAKGGMKNDVKEEKKNAGNAVETASTETPSQKDVKPKVSADMQQEDAGKKPFIPKAEAAAPKPKTDEEISMEKEAQDLDDEMANNDVSEEQLTNANEESFTGAVTSKNDAQTKARNTPNAYRALEQPQIAKAEAQAKATVAGKMEEMHEGRKDAFAKVDEGKDTTKTKDEEKRIEIANNLQRIYNGTKEKVTKILNDLETAVVNDFDTAANAANAVFERNVRRRLKDHYGWTTVDDTVGDFLRGSLSPEIGKIFREEKKTFMDAMNVSINSIATKVEKELNAAIQAIDDGKKEIDTYWNSLTPETQKIGEDAKKDISDKFGELEQSVHDKHDELVEKLGDRYVKNIEKLQETFDKIKAENQGWLSKALDAIVGVIKTILRLKDMLLETLAKVAHVVGKIIKDPIGFLSNLIAAVKMGLDNFVKNIMDHMKKGFIAWLLGNMPPGLQLPDKWDLPGIFHFVMQIIGLTWTNIRQRAVLKLGEPVVAALEEVFDIFQIIIKEGLPGLWRYIKEKVGNLQVMVMDAIQDFLIEKIIKAGITWVIGLLNPAGAFIKACKLIYDIVMFFVERGRQIMNLVNAVIDSVALIVEGSLGQAAKMVEDALAKMIPVTLGFLAALLGLNGISEKVQKIIKAVQAPINKAIDWVLDKAIAFAKKLGLDKAVKKVKGGINKAKDWAKEKVKQGKEKVKQVGAKIMGWIGLKKKVNVRKGETHTLYFNKGSKKMMMASTPVVFGDFINTIVIPVKKQSKLNPVKAGIVSMLQQVDGLIANTTMSEDDKQQKIQAILEIIGPEIAELIRETSGALLTSEAPRYGGLHGGFGTSMRVRIVDGNPATTGGQPSVGGGNWDALRKRKTSMGSKDTFYIRAHLLNDNLGGPGDTWSNLSILSQQANNRDWYGSGSHETAVETRLKGPLSENGKGFIYIVTANYSRSQNTALINIVDSLIAFKNSASGVAPVVPSDYSYLNGYSVAQLTDVKQILEAEKFVPTTFVCTIKEIDPSVGEEVVSSDHNINRTITNDIQSPYYL